jgi:hypothetical protein
MDSAIQKLDTAAADVRSGGSAAAAASVRAASRWGQQADASINQLLATLSEQQDRLAKQYAAVDLVPAQQEAEPRGAAADTVADKDDQAQAQADTAASADIQIILDAAFMDAAGPDATYEAAAAAAAEQLAMADAMAFASGVGSSLLEPPRRPGCLGGRQRQADGPGDVLAQQLDAVQALLASGFAAADAAADGMAGGDAVVMVQGGGGAPGGAAWVSLPADMDSMVIVDQPAMPSSADLAAMDAAVGAAMAGQAGGVQVLTLMPATHNWHRAFVQVRARNGPGGGGGGGGLLGEEAKAAAEREAVH